MNPQPLRTINAALPRRSSWYIAMVFSMLVPLTSSAEETKDNAAQQQAMATQAVHELLTDQSTDFVKHLLEKDKLNIESKNERGETPLITAAKQGRTDLLLLLLVKQANIEATDKDQNTALHHASYHSKVEIVSLLLKLGADTNATNKNQSTVLHEALRRRTNEPGESKKDRIDNQLNIATQLLARNKGLLNLKDSNFQTPLALANDEAGLADGIKKITAKPMVLSSDAPNSKAVATNDPGFIFKNLGIGGAIGWTHNLGSRRVETVDVVNNIVRIQDERNDLIRFMPEVHLWAAKFREDTIGIGPFFALAPGQKFVDAFALGIMFGYRAKNTDQYSFNVGVGAMLDLDTKVLGDGITRNQPLPAGETSARTKQTTVAGLLVMFSIGWDVYAAHNLAVE